MSHEAQMVSFCNGDKNMRTLMELGAEAPMEFWDTELYCDGTEHGRADMTLNSFCQMAEQAGFSDYYDLIDKLDSCGEWTKWS